jgi:hypothetical protein
MKSSPMDSEGISHWVSQVVSGYLVAQLTGCDFFLDYDEGIDILAVGSDAIFQPGLYA